MTCALHREPDGSAAGALPDASSTLALGACLAPQLLPGMKLYLSGDLGSGKTTLVRGILRGLGYSGPVRSPTFTLLESYNLSSLDVHHFDFYRFKAQEEWREAGFRDEFGSTAVCVVEWPEKAGALLPAADLAIEMRYEVAGEVSGRTIRLRGLSQRGRQCVEGLLK
jgi:tRNA threonylcarbamoyladenosine biosynthesis protein TsaE